LFSLVVSPLTTKLSRLNKDTETETDTDTNGRQFAAIVRPLGLFLCGLLKYCLFTQLTLIA